MRHRFRTKSNGWGGTIIAVTAAVVLALAPASAASTTSDSQRLSRAKDHIADEQWARAIDELTTALKDEQESARDEVMFWLAHSLHHQGDSAEALETVDQLRREFPRSRWVGPANSLRIDIAFRLRRDELIWHVVTQPPEAPDVARPIMTSQAPADAATPVHRSRPVEPAPVALSEIDLRIQALGTLIATDADKVMPMLEDIALKVRDVGAARRALFVLAQSDRPDARSVVMRVAREASEPVRVAAVRELARFGDPVIDKELLVVYEHGSQNLKQQVIRTLGASGGAQALVEIVRREPDHDLRDSAILMLGRAGGRNELRAVYRTASTVGTRKAVVTALFTASADEPLIQIAKTDPSDEIRKLAVDRLRLLDTAQARAYLASLK